MSLKMPGELTSAKEVADAYHAPFDATARVMQIMAQNSLLRAEQGSFGGYQITRDLSRVSLYELIVMILGPVGIAKCIHHGSCEIQNTCNILSPIQVLNQKLNEFYQSLSIKDLLQTHPAPLNFRPSKTRKQTNTTLPVVEEA